MEKKKAIWASIWLSAFIVVFLICVISRSSSAGGAFILVGIILAVIARIVFGSTSRAATSQSVVYTKVSRSAMISPTIMREIGKERYLQEEKEGEWSIGFGLTLTGILIFLGGLLGSAYLRHTG